jgi:hypothetical protein
MMATMAVVTVAGMYRAVPAAMVVVVTATVTMVVHDNAGMASVAGAGMVI